MSIASNLQWSFKKYQLCYNTLPDICCTTTYRTCSFRFLFYLTTKILCCFCRTCFLIGCLMAWLPISLPRIIQVWLCYNLFVQIIWFFIVSIAKSIFWRLLSEYVPASSFCRYHSKFICWNIFSRNQGSIYWNKYGLMGKKISWKQRARRQKRRKRKKGQGKKKISDKKTEQEQCFIKLWKTWKCKQ